MSNHIGNTGPMLASPRCGAKTRSGGACRSPAVHATSAAAYTAAHRGPARHRYVARSLVALAPYYREVIADLPQP